jgi:hypothetical protein
MTPDGEFNVSSFVNTIRGLATTVRLACCTPRCVDHMCDSYTPLRNLFKNFQVSGRFRQVVICMHEA